MSPRRSSRKSSREPFSPRWDIQDRSPSASDFLNTTGEATSRHWLQKQTRLFTPPNVLPKTAQRHSKPPTGRTVGPVYDCPASLFLGLRAIALALRHFAARYRACASPTAPTENSGNSITKVVPCPAAVSNETRPSCLLAIARTTLKPKPAPAPAAFVVMKGSKTCSCICGGIPGPLSSISIRTC